MKTLVTEGANMKPVRAVRRDDRFLSLAQIDKFTMSFIEFCMYSMRNVLLITGRNTHA